MKFLIAVTDRDWFEFLRAKDDLDEANFWQPSGSTNFRALDPGEPMLFKLHAPDHYIVGGGFFATFSRLPYRMAWEFFGEKNGAESLPRMRERIEQYRSDGGDRRANYQIGCIILTDLFFFDEADWIPVPSDFSKNIVRYKGYRTEDPVGGRVWEQVQMRLQAATLTLGESEEQPSLYSEPTLTRRRLGQGGFRTVITDTYRRRCAVTGERALPVLEAAHILPVSEGGRHQVSNGLLLRADLHRLFDEGYVSVTLDYEVEVSRRLKDDFDNGEPYYPLEGNRIWTPQEAGQRPSREFLEWHRDTVFRT